MKGPAVASRPKPQDRQQKKQPLQRSVDVVLNDDVLNTFEAAQADLAAAEEKSRPERERLFHLSRTATMAPAELLDLDRQIGERIGEDLTPLRDALAAAMQAVRDATTTYTFQSIGRHAYRQILDEHPPRDEDHAAQQEDTGNEQAKARWNGDTFPPALVQAACVDPVLSDADVTDMWDTWNDNELVELFVTALAVNAQRRVVDLGKARG